jgi:aspartate aminotransferase-like enzyme
MEKPMLMTPGPTCVDEDVRRALSMEITNPDLDIILYIEEYINLFKQDVAEGIKRLIK